MSKVLLFDTETTGKDIQDRIIQLGLAIADIGDITNFVHIEDFCSAPVPINIEAMEVHHITPEMLIGKKEISEVDSYINLCLHNNDSNYFVAHNINFDLNMLAKEGFVCHAKIIDTHRCAKHLLKEFKTHRLQFLRYALGLYKQDMFYPVESINAHSALGDVFTMHQLLNHLLDNLKRDEPERDPFEYLVELTKQPVLVEEFPFGKHKGDKLYTIPTSYLNWALSNINDLSEDLRYSIQITLKQHPVLN